MRKLILAIHSAAFASVLGMMVLGPLQGWSWWLVPMTLAGLSAGIGIVHWWDLVAEENEIRRFDPEIARYHRELLEKAEPGLTLRYFEKPREVSFRRYIKLDLATDHLVDRKSVVGEPGEHPTDDSAS